jgi:hypothetical protein
MLALVASFVDQKTDSPADGGTLRREGRRIAWRGEQVSEGRGTYVTIYYAIIVALECGTLIRL